MLTGSSGCRKAVLRKKVMSVSEEYSSLPTELSLSWEEKVSLVSGDVSVWGLCAKNGFPSCAQWIFASKEAYSSIGGRAVMCVTTATKAITRDKFSTDRGCLRCCGNFWADSGNLSALTIITADEVQVTQIASLHLLAAKGTCQVKVC